MPSLQLSTRCALVLLCATLLASVAGLLALGPVGPGALPWTRASDAATLPQAWGLLLQLPLLAAALAGWRAARASVADAALRRAWLLAFALVGLAALAGIAQSVAADAAGGLPARLPGASAIALLSLIFLAERLHPAWVAPAALGLGLASGPLAGALALLGGPWLGMADLRTLLWLEHLPLLLAPIGVWGLRSRGLGDGDWLLALTALATAWLLGWADDTVRQALGGLVGGAALQPLLLAAAAGRLAWALGRQPSAAEAPAGASQRSTSLNTAG